MDRSRLTNPDQTQESPAFIIIPAYNEGAQIARTIAGLDCERYVVVVVDDCSTDDTFEAAWRMGVRVLRHPINLGQGAALQTGMSYALEMGARYLVHFDADGQHRPDEIPALLQPVIDGTVDLALGSRFLTATDRSAVPAGRRWLLRAAVVFNGLMTGVWLSDAHNGFRAMTADAARKLKLAENRSAHATELLNRIVEGGLTYVEVPTHIQYTDYSRAKGQSASAAFRIAVDLFLNKVFG
jgi:glycosyltransferase involved in cell wall biosynthesis